MKAIWSKLCISISGLEYFTLYEGWLRFESITSYYADSDTILKNQLNQKLKLIFQAPSYIIYSNKKHCCYVKTVEYVKTYKVNEKTDVYSFGVILLELVTGKEPHKGDEYSSLAEWSFKHYNDGQLIQDSFDKEILEPCFLDDMIYMFQLGLMCTSIEPHHRPSMKDVLRLLEKMNNLEDSRSDKERKDHDYSPRL